MKRLKRMLTMFFNRLRRFVRIELQKISFRDKPIIVSFVLLIFIFEISSNFLLVYIRTSGELEQIFVEYSDLIKPLAKIDQILFLTEDPTDEFFKIVDDDEYRFYFKSQ